MAEKTYDPNPYYLVSPVSKPRSFLPLEDDKNQNDKYEKGIDRAGMPRNRHVDPKNMMMGWAEQKIRDEAPEAQGKTIIMIMRAEPRTVSAIMHAKS